MGDERAAAAGGARRGSGRRIPDGTRGLLALVIGLGVLILAGFGVVAVTLVHRSFGGGHAHAGGAPAGTEVATSNPGQAAIGDVFLGEPAGSRIVSMATTGGRLALLLAGGGGGDSGDGAADRVILLDVRSGRRLGTIRLATAPDGASAPAVPTPPAVPVR